MAWVPSKSINETGGSFNITHPFKIFLKKELKQGQSQPIYSYAVAYHSQLFKNTFTNKTTYFEFQSQKITGLDAFEVIPNPENKNIYITLDMKVSNLVVTSAEINFYQEGAKGLAPFTVDSNYNQTFAQSILGVIVNDSESQAGMLADNQTTYIIQKVFTDLIITNIIINNVPVIAAVPCWGGPIN